MLTARDAYLVLRLALLAIVLATFTHTSADPDLWGHVRFGGDTIAAHGVPRVAPYSFTADRPWINHEWLAECLMYVAYVGAGGTGLILLKIVLLIGMVGAVVFVLRRCAIPPIAADALCGLVLIATLPQATDVRPQLFSLVLFAWLLALLSRSAEGRHSLLWLVVPMMALWANLHGGWLAGVGTVVLWAAVGLMTNAPAPERAIACVIAVAAVAATLANPYGWHLWMFLRETVGFGRPNIVEWQPVYRLLPFAPGVPLIWLTLAIATILAVRSAFLTRSLEPRAVAIVTALAVASFRVNRLLAFFAIGISMLMPAPLTTAAGLTRPDRSRAPTASPAAAAVLAAIGLIVFAGGITLSVFNSRCVVMDSEESPEPQVVALVKERGLHGRMITWFNWGEYAIWHLSPAIAVSMDGRRETVYSDAVIGEHETFYTRPDERHVILDRLEPDYVWLPSSLEVVRRLQSDGWVPLFSGNRSVLLGRRAADPSIYTPAAVAVRCFPGP
jgi:hypothetical protein